MQLDPRTMALYTAAIGVALAALALAFRRTQHTYPGFGHWVLALVLFSAALASIGLRGIVPDGLALHGPPGFGFATALAIVSGQDRFFGRHIPFGRLLAAAVAGGAAVTATAALGSMSAAQGLGALCVGAALLFAAWRFVRLASAPLQTPARFCAAVLALLGLTRLWRGWVFVEAGPGYDVLAASTASSVNYAVNAVFVTLWSFAFTFLNAGRLASDLEASRDELRRLSVTDPLTGLPNRRAFFEDAEAEIRRAQRYGFPVSVLMLDLDHFKQVNDRHGHEAGDHLLSAVAALIRRELRTSDILGRLGGEEFAVLLAQATAADAALTAERLLRAVPAAAIEHAGARIAASISVGVASASAGGRELAVLLRRADAALYEAKRGGRNRVVASAPEAEDPATG